MTELDTFPGTDKLFSNHRIDEKGGPDHMSGFGAAFGHESVHILDIKIELWPLEDDSGWGCLEGDFLYWLHG